MSEYLAVLTAVSAAGGEGSGGGMGLIVTIGDLVSFAPNIGILVHPEGIAAGPEILYEAVLLADSHIQDPDFVEECCGSGSPIFGDRWKMSLEEYLVCLERAESARRIATAGRVAKRRCMSARRAEFQRLRPVLVLAMLASGVPHICAVEDGDEVDSLHVDHIQPLSRGGTDELHNLQFLCGPHNCSKGDR